jgi:small subunit ribosomal protein S21
MLIVNIKNGNIETALKEYKRKVQKLKQVEELRERKEFTKKSVKKRLQLEEAKRKNKYFL